MSVIFCDKGMIDVIVVEGTRGKACNFCLRTLFHVEIYPSHLFLFPILIRFKFLLFGLPLTAKSVPLILCITNSSE